MVERGEFFDSVAVFARNLAGGFDISDVLHDLCERVTSMTDEVDAAGVSVLTEDRLRFATALDEVTSQLERVQDHEQRGPCVDAARGGQAVLVSDLAARNPYGVYGSTALGLGIHAVAGIPLLASAPIGALNLYRYQPSPWADADIAAARVFADMAASYIVNASALQQQRRMTEQLQEALESRVVIEQAKGLLAREHGCSPDQAFARLRGYARNHNENIHTVAKAVIDLGLRP